MSMETVLKIGLTYTDRVLALIDGTVSDARLDCRIELGRPNELFSVMLSAAPFDACEMSLGNYVIERSRGRTDLVALPIFLSRSFRHSAIYAARDGRPLAPSARMRIGVPEYQMTAAIWARSILRRELGVSPEDVDWFTGSVGGGTRSERIPLADLEGISITASQDNRGLAALLIDGSLDLLIAPDAPAAYGSGDGPIVRYFSDYHAREVSYFRKTGVFPIMHVLVMRAELCQRWPWLPDALYGLFTRAKDAAIERLSRTDVMYSALAWLPGVVDEHRALLGSDIWPYGIAANRLTLEAFIAECARQRLLAAPVALEDLFPRGATGQC